MDNEYKEIERVLQENMKEFQQESLNFPPEPVFAFAEGREFMKGYLCGSVVTLVLLAALAYLMGV